MSNVPIGGLEMFLSRREAQYLDQLLVVFAMRELNAGLQLVNKPIHERAGSLYNFMLVNFSLRSLFQRQQDAGGGIWMTSQGVEHVIAAISMVEPSDMPPELQIEHSACSEKLIDRIVPKLTYVEKLVGRWDESPLTDKTNKWD